MSRVTVSKQPIATSIARALGAWLLAGVLSAHATCGYAHEPAAPTKVGASQNIPHAPTNIEKAFWACDYAAATRWVGPDEGAMCGTILEELKKSKFGGDFQAMLEWWQTNKTAEHQALASERRPSIAR
ncbi:MAG TPA: hypothetical protein VGK44_06500 [Casimicrobiaceae bacterium]|jgi:hypothetical protein